MTQPTPYTPGYNFTQYQVSHPSTPLPAASVDSELLNIAVCFAQICQNLALIQRDDGALANLSVGNDQLKTEVSFGFNSITTWVHPHAYVVRDFVIAPNSSIYRCIASHTSTASFTNDLNNGFWQIVVDFATPLTAASNSAAAAASSATAAASSASNAGTSQTNAAASAVAAAASAATAVAAVAGAGTIASAGTTDIGSVAAAFLNVTGTTGITSFGSSLPVGQTRVLRFAGAPAITHNASSLILPGGQNMVTASGDMANVTCISTGNYRVEFFRGDGSPLLLGARSGGTSGYKTFTDNNGDSWTVQWGTLQLTTTIASTFVSSAVTLPVPFSTAGYQAFATIGNPTSNQLMTAAAVFASASQITVYLASEGAVTDQPVSWLVIGK